MQYPSVPSPLNIIRPEINELLAYSSSHGEEGEMLSDLDKLDTNESPYDLTSEEKEKLAWHYQNIVKSNRYPDGGHGKLKQSIAEYLNETAPSPIQPAQISVGNGSDELIRSLLIATCVGTNASILIAEPTFSMYKILAQTLGITCISIPREQTHFTINRGQAEQAIAQGKATGHPVKVMFVVHPNSPTGNLLTEVELEWLKGLPEEILVVIDEAYFEFSGRSLIGELSQRPNWTILRTFSKAFRLAAHRVGYCIGDPQLIAALEKIRLPYNLPTFSQAAALVALEKRDRLLSTIAETQQERETLYNFLASQPSLKVWKSAANFIYFRFHLVSSEQTENQYQDFVKTLKQQGTLVRHIANGIRVTVGSPQENQRTRNNITAYFQALAS